MSRTHVALPSRAPRGRARGVCAVDKDSSVHSKLLQRRFNSDHRWGWGALRKGAPPAGREESTWDLIGSPKFQEFK